ncbi:hypothetical protein J2W32_001477 [Variovorax boronicumulans]|uniref:Uncharacterized protein n=1 Tax=Variovorax boronicumulans TaxID=436515 RepID=A0AAW8CP27_9BURK|nr:hypothetical protein [Variovorax boronicumulans]MDP9893218.1 hypothetical protein [Variovorax boronicumulans]MDQ0052435.1 hypothetical protein [Variovorax boronicumulans]
MANDTTNALACAKACQDAQELVSQIRTRQALPDSLHAALQAIRATGDGERLRAFTRQIAKAIEGSR